MAATRISPSLRRAESPAPLRGSEWAQAQVLPLWYWDTPCVDLGPGENRRWRANDQIAFWWLVRGRLRVVYDDGRTEEVGAGRAVLQPTIRHQESWSPDTALVSIRVTASWPGGRPFNRLERTLALDPVVSAPLLPLSRNLGAQVHRLSRQAPGTKVLLPDLHLGAGGHAGLMAAFWAWFASLTEACAAAGHHWQGAGTGDGRIDALVALVAGWDLTRPLDQAAVTAATGLSPAGARRLALRRLGATPRELLERRRLRLAEELLRWHDLPQRELARSLGFTQAGHCGQWFRRRTGLTPDRWRRRRHEAAFDI
jgi:AraC-like DNA-binding protein